MKTISRLITFSLIFHFAFQPNSVQAQVAQEGQRKVPFTLVKLLTKELKTNQEAYFSKEELSMPEAIVEKSITNTAVEEIKAKLKDNSFSMDEIKETLNRQMMMEEQNRLIELANLLSRISQDKLDEFFQASMRDGMYGNDFTYSYTSAYGQHEKIEVLMQMIRSDMSLIRSQNAKQIGLMSRADILKQLESTGQILNYKDDKFLTILIIVLTVAAAGLITWGIVSATKARHERKKAELNADFDNQEAQAESDYDASIKSLEQVFAEREKYREEGYVWTVCSTTKTVKTASCSYDYNAYSGEEVCVTNCMKQPTTGAEVMPTTSCTSSFIPNNCFQKNPTAAGYDDGYDSGYSSGYDTGYDRAYDSAYNSAYDNAYSSAYNSGYNSGYDSGFSSGYSDGVADSSDDDGKSFSAIKKMLSGNEDEYQMGYGKGFKEGYSYALQLKVGIAQ